jgi:hypothetical protein
MLLRGCAPAEARSPILKRLDGRNGNHRALCGILRKPRLKRERPDFVSTKARPLCFTMNHAAARVLHRTTRGGRCVGGMEGDGKEVFVAQRRARFSAMPAPIQRSTVAFRLSKFTGFVMNSQQPAARASSRTSFAE